MSVKQPKRAVSGEKKMRDAWIADVAALIDQVEEWCKQEEWPTRRENKEMEDSEVGNYRVPMLLIQNWEVRLLLEPVARVTIGSDGLVDLYRMPAYDDIAHIFRVDGKWQVQAPFANGNGAVSHRSPSPRPFVKSQFVKVVQALRAQHAQV